MKKLIIIAVTVVFGMLLLGLSGCEINDNQKTDCIICKKQFTAKLWKDNYFCRDCNIRFYAFLLILYERKDDITFKDKNGDEYKMNFPKLEAK